MATKLDEIEKRLWAIADDLRANSGLKASEYSEPVLGLIFLRFASERFKKATSEIKAEKPAGYEITDEGHEVMIATTNVGHLSRLATAKEWRNIP